MKTITLIIFLFIALLTFIRPISSNIDNFFVLSFINPSANYTPWNNPDTTCQQAWVLAILSFRKLGIDLSKNDFVKILNCGPKYISLMYAVASENIEYATKAVELYPENYESWLWLGEASNPADMLTAQNAYLQTVTIAPRNALTWCRLGSIYETKQDNSNALTAFLNCCRFDDPGSNGCYGAGRMAEKLGDLQQAIEYYRLSRWEGALKRADELEAELDSGN